MRNMSKNDKLPVDERQEINQDEIDGQEDALIITSDNESKAIYGQEYSDYDDLNWSSSDDSSSVLF